VVAVSLKKLLTGQFPNAFDGVWWSFLRLTDPGYLGDDEGAVLRVQSTIITVLGYVLFMGSLVAIMTQWLSRTLRNFESGMAPIAMRGHVVILGWTNRTPEILGQLLSAKARLFRFLETHDQRMLRVVVVADEVSAERRYRLRNLESGMVPIAMRGHVVILGWTNRTPEILGQLLSAKARLSRFLEAHDQRKLRVVVVADEVSAERRYRLRNLLGRRWRERQIFLRAGSGSEPADLERFDLRRAAAIVVPGDEFSYGGTESSDARVVRTLLNLRPILESIPEDARPLVVVEMFDATKERAARRAIKGRLEVVPGDAVIARILAQTIRDRRLARVFIELLSQHRGCALFIRAFPELAGAHPMEVDGRFDRAVVIGAVRREAGRPVTHLNPPPDFRLDRDDMLVLIARTYEDCEPTRDAGYDRPATLAARTAAQDRSVRRVLLLGWSYKTGSIIREIAKSELLDFDVTLVSRIPEAERNEILNQALGEPSRVRVRHIEADYAASGVLENLELRTFDSVMLLAGMAMETAEDADARSSLGYELVKSVLEEQIPEGEKRPTVIVELVDPASTRLFSDPEDVVLVGPRLLGYLQANVVLRDELNSVFNELCAPGGAEVAVRPAADYGLTGSVSYSEVRERRDRALPTSAPFVVVRRRRRHHRHFNANGA
jgi:hypothetical protein